LDSVDFLMNFDMKDTDRRISRQSNAE
jgi:hypothetical protein